MQIQALSLLLHLSYLAALGLHLAASDLNSKKSTDKSLKRQDANSLRADLPEQFVKDAASLLETRPISTSASVSGTQTTNTNGSGSADKKQRRHIRVATLESPPFMMKRKIVTEDDPPQDPSSNNARATQTVEWYGYCMDFFMEMIKQLPYEVSFDIYEVADGKFGSKTREILVDSKNNKSQPVKVEYWNGLVSELEQQRAHLALAPLAVMAERELVVDFTVPFYDLVGIQILLKRPEVPQNWFKFLTVLDNDVWLSVTLAYFVTSLIIYLFDRLSPYSHKNQRRIQKSRERRRKKANERVASHQEKPPFGPPFLLGASLSAGQVRPTVPNASANQHHLKSSLLLLPTSRDSSRDATQDNSNAGSSNNNNNKRRISQEYLQSLRMRFGPSGGPQHNSVQPVMIHNDPQEDSEEDSDDEQGPSSEPDFNLRDSLWFCITSLTPQGGGEAPQNLSGRVVAGAWWLFCFIVIASYTANLAAFLTVSRLEIPIESLDDLAKQYRIKYAPIDGTAEQSFFERMAYIEEIFYNIWKEMSLNDSLSEEERSKFSVWDYPISDKFTKIWAQIQEVQMPANLEQALARVRASTLDDGFALLANANMIKWATMTDCSFKAVGEEFSRKPIALALSKGMDELRDDMSYAILQLINKRYMEVLREKWWTNNPSRVVCELHDESEGISIENIGGVFIIILAGVLLSFLVWAIERLAYRTKVEVSRELLKMSRGQQQKKSSNFDNVPQHQQIATTKT